MLERFLKRPKEEATEKLTSSSFVFVKNDGTEFPIYVSRGVNMLLGDDEYLNVIPIAETEARIEYAKFGGINKVGIKKVRIVRHFWGINPEGEMECSAASIQDKNHPAQICDDVVIEDSLRILRGPNSKIIFKG